MKLSRFLMALCLGFAFTTLSFGQISGTGHDFSGDAWNSTNQICVVCHTPHNALSANGPLWNHEEVAAASYTLYSSSTFDATMGQPSGESLLCLSCHDGSIALDSFGGGSGTSYISGSADLGTDLSTHHPISFTYDGTLATTDGGLYDPTSQASGLGGTITADMLFSGSMECASCHDVHNSTGVSMLLLKDNTNSALCLTCHDK